MQGGVTLLEGLPPFLSLIGVTGGGGARRYWYSRQGPCIGEGSSKAFDHPVIPEPAQNKVLAVSSLGTALSVLL